MKFTINKEHFYNLILWGGMFIIILFTLLDNKRPLNMFELEGIFVQELSETELWKKMQLQEQAQLKETIKQTILELEREKTNN